MKQLLSSYYKSFIGQGINPLYNIYVLYNIQGDLYSFINILTSGRLRSQKALDNKILSHT
jgi:hypothetical protein